MDSLEQGKKIIRDKIPLITNNPGVYKMLSVSGEILDCYDQSKTIGL